MVLGLWFESARAMFFLFILLNALPVPMLRQVFLEVQNRAPMQVKLTFSEKYRFCDFQKRCFTCMGAHFSWFSTFSCYLDFSGAP